MTKLNNNAVNVLSVKKIIYIMYVCIYIYIHTHTHTHTHAAFCKTEDAAR